MGQNVKHSSGTNEQYTPLEVIAAAREVLERIDLDPASSHLANTRVQADRIFTEADGADTFTNPWEGRVWMNPPGGVTNIVKGVGVRSNPVLFWRKLIYEWQNERVEMAITLGFTLEVLQTTQNTDLPMLRFPLCIPRRRLVFDTPREARIEALQGQLRAAEQQDKPERTLREIRKKLASAETSADDLVPGDQPPHCNVLVFTPPLAEYRGPEGGWYGTYCERFQRVFSSLGVVRL